MLRLALLLATLTAAPAPAQEVVRHRDWSSVTAPAGCFATTSLGLRNPGSGLLGVTLYHQASGAGVMTLRVPLGASLASGIAYSHANQAEAIGLAWQYCDGESCLASGGVSEAEIARFKAEREIFVAFRPLPRSNALIVPVSLLGFTKAWAAVTECSAQ